MTASRLLLACLLVLAACGTDAPPVPNPVTVPPVVPAVPAVPAVPGVPSVPGTTAGASCIAGRWRANDLVEMVRRSARSSLRNNDGQLTHAGGTFDVTITPPDAAGRGTATAQAVDLVHRGVVRQQGVTANVTLTMTGTSTTPYTLVAPDGIVVDRPTDGPINVRGSVVLSGPIKARQGASDRFDLAGAYVYECDNTTLRVWDRNENGQRRGQPVVYDRVP